MREITGEVALSPESRGHNTQSRVETGGWTGPTHLLKAHRLRVAVLVETLTADRNLNVERVGQSSRPKSAEGAGGIPLFVPQHQIHSIPGGGLEHPWNSPNGVCQLITEAGAVAAAAAVTASKTACSDRDVESKHCC